MKKIIYLILVLAIIVMPMLTFAADEFMGPCPDGSAVDPITGRCDGGAGDSCGSLSGIYRVLCVVQNVFNWLVLIFIALGVVYFVWGVVQFIKSDSEEDRQKGKDRMIYGIIGFAVILGLWGLVNILGKTFDLDSGNPNNSAPTNDRLKGLLPR
jgi:hypothetical protein